MAVRGNILDSLKIVRNFAQECIGKLPVILLGSGASAPHGIPGMWPLGLHLRDSKVPDDATQEDLDGWTQFRSILMKKDLESALTGISLTKRMTQHVVSTTWDYLSPHDVDVFEQVALNRRLLPLTRLFEYLFRSTHTEIQVVTPNYDRLAEYAAEAGGYTAYSGFTLGSLTLRASSPPPKVFYGKSHARTVNVWKVHGSFGWFISADDVVIGLPPARTRPPSLEPAIITPGIEKYRRTHEEPFRTTMAQADQAVRSASAFFCVGYGFNDQHLQPLLAERSSLRNVPLILITKEISKKAHDFFKSGKCQRYMALEESGDATRVFSKEVPEGFDIPNTSYWQLSNFLELIM